MSQKIYDSMGPSVTPSQVSVDQEQVTGNFMGERVAVLDDPMSLIEDAAEELTFSASEDVERKLSERKETRDKMRGQYIHYVEACPDLEPQDLEQFMQSLRSLLGAKNASVLALVRQQFSDPTHQHAALSYARHQAGAASPELAELLDQALETLEQEQGQAIQAGYNIVAVPAGDLETSPSGLRVLYRDTLIDFESYEKTFTALLDKFGPDELPAAVQYLIKALGADMNAVTPSTDKAAIKEVMDGLYMVESLATLYKQAQSLLKSAGERHGSHNISERQILEPLLKYKDAPLLLEMQILRDMPFLDSNNASRDAELTQGVRELVRAMPHKIFVSLESRQNTLNAFQEVLDKAIDREEAELEG